MPLINGFCPCFGKVRLFFAVQVQRPILKYWYLKSAQNQYFVRKYLWQSRNHISCETGLKGVPCAFLRQYIDKGSVCRVIFPYKLFQPSKK